MGTLTYDGFGVNGPVGDYPKERLAKFMNHEIAEKWGPLFEAAPDLLEALKALVAHGSAVNTAFYVDGTSKAMKAAMQGQKELLQAARAAISKATGA